jgi:hypothetical protein
MNSLRCTPVRLAGVATACALSVWALVPARGQPISAALDGPDQAAARVVQLVRPHAVTQDKVEPAATLVERHADAKTGSAAEHLPSSSSRLASHRSR